MARNLSLLLLLIGAAGCWADFPEARLHVSSPDLAPRPDLAAGESLPRTEAGPGQEGLPGLERPPGLEGTPPPKPDLGTPDRPRTDVLFCSPNSTISCTADKSGIVKCNAAGTATLVVGCAPYQCQAPQLVCDGCTPGAPPACDKNALVTCSANGLPVITPCPKACKDGACL